MFTAPTAFRAIKREDPNASIDQALRPEPSSLFLAGERCDPDTLSGRRDLGVPVIDHWWQTETGWAIAANCMGLQHCRSSRARPPRPVPGYDVQVLDDDRPGAAGRSAAS
jgi:propionyl-CoA synthetase